MEVDHSMQKMNRKWMNKKGFSLIELIVAISILVVLTGLIVPNFLSKPEEARLEACLNERNVIANAYRTELLTEEMTTEEQNDQSKRYSFYQYCLREAMAGTIGAREGIAFDDSHAYTWNETDSDATPCKDHGDYTFRVGADGALQILCSYHAEPPVEVAGMMTPLEGGELYADTELTQFDTISETDTVRQFAIKLDKSVVEMTEQGGTATVTASAMTSEGVTVDDSSWEWESSNDAVALVSPEAGSNVVTITVPKGQKGRMASITVRATATDASGATLTATAAVTVTTGSTAEDLAVMISTGGDYVYHIENCLMVTDTTKKLFARILNANTWVGSVEGYHTEWASDDTNVVAIGSDGTMTALKPGNALITLSLKKGDVAAAQATCYVTVIDKITAVRIEEDENKTVEMTLPRLKTKKVKVFVATGDKDHRKWTEVTSDEDLPEGYKLLWESVHPEVATAAKNLVSAHKSGETNITVSVVENATKTAMKSNILHVTVSGGYKLEIVPYKGKLISDVDDEIATFVNNGNYTGIADDDSFIIFNAENIKDESNHEITIDGTKYKINWLFSDELMSGSLAKGDEAHAASDSKVDEDYVFNDNHYENSEYVRRTGIKIKTKNAGKFSVQAQLLDEQNDVVGESKTYTCTVIGRPKRVVIKEAKDLKDEEVIYGAFNEKKQLNAIVYDKNGNETGVSSALSWSVRWQIHPETKNFKFSTGGLEATGTRTTVEFPSALWSKQLEKYETEKDVQNTKVTVGILEDHRKYDPENKKYKDLQSYEARFQVQTYTLIPEKEINTNTNPVLAGDKITFHTDFFRDDGKGNYTINNANTYAINYSAEGTNAGAVTATSSGDPGSPIIGTYTFHSPTINQSGDKSVTLKATVSKEGVTWGAGYYTITYVDEATPEYYIMGQTPKYVTKRTYQNTNDVDYEIHVGETVKIRRQTSRTENHQVLNVGNMINKGWSFYGNNDKAYKDGSDVPVSDVAEVNLVWKDNYQDYTIEGKGAGILTLSCGITAPGDTAYSKEGMIRIRVVENEP